MITSVSTLSPYTQACPSVRIVVSAGAVIPAPPHALAPLGWRRGQAPPTPPPPPGLPDRPPRRGGPCAHESCGCSWKPPAPPVPAPPCSHPGTARSPALRPPPRHFGKSRSALRAAPAVPPSPSRE